MKITNNPPAAKPLASSGPARSGATGRQPAATGSGSASTDQAARLSQLEAALHAMGKRLVVSVEDDAPGRRARRAGR